jgi:hypothetical protein
MCALASSRKRISTRGRFCGFWAAQPGWAAAAEAIAARVSSASASATRACTAPVAGSNTSAVAPEAPSTRRPSR